MRKLPKDPNKAFTVNGINFANRKEYDDRIEEDTRKLAEFLYDVYQDKKRKQKTSHNNDSTTSSNRGE